MQASAAPFGLSGALAPGAVRRSAVLAVFAAAALWFLPIALGRLVDGDEGYYLMAARLVAQGEVLYRDFFFPQMPLVPYAYGLWMVLAGESFGAARVLSAGLAAMTATLVFVHVLLHTGRMRSAILTTVLLATSGMAIGWLTVAKTYALSVALLVAAFVLAQWPRARTGHGRAGSGRGDPMSRDLLSGLCLGLAVASRLMLAPLVVWFALRLVVTEGGRRRWWLLLAGVGIGLAPCLVLAWLAPAQFRFGNLGYHGLRHDGGLVGHLPVQLYLARMLLGLGVSDGATSYQTSLLVGLSVVALFGSWRRWREHWFAGAVAITIVAVSFLPNPPYPQYFVVALPFLALAAGRGVDVWLERARTNAGRAVAWVATAAVLLAYLGLAAGEVGRYTTSGDGVRGLEGRLADDWTLASQAAVAAAIDDALSAAATTDAASDTANEVLATWPGYLIGSSAQPTRGIENHFAFLVGAALDPEQRQRYQIASEGDLRLRIGLRLPELVVLDDGLAQPVIERWERTLKGSGYRRVGTVAAADLYQRIETVEPR